MKNRKPDMIDADRELVADLAEVLHEYTTCGEVDVDDLCDSVASALGNRFPDFDLDAFDATIDGQTPQEGNDDGCQ